MSRSNVRMRSFSASEESDQLATVRMWSERTSDGSRSDLSFRPFPAVWEAVQSEDGNCLGRECPKYKECFFYQARRRVQHANILIVNHALFVTDLALRKAGDFGVLPKYDVAILDEAHTFEAVAGQHLGLQISSLGVDLRLARLYNERNGKGLLGFKKLDAAINQLKRARNAADDFFARIDDWHHRQPANFNGRVRSPLGMPEILPEELRRLASAIHEGAQKFEQPEERIELDAAELRCRALADEISAWLRQAESDNVYWVELENKSRTRIRLASAPLDVGPKLRSMLFDKVPTCVLTSATLVRRLAAEV